MGYVARKNICEHVSIEIGTTGCMQVKGTAGEWEAGWEPWEV